MNERCKGITKISNYSCYNYVVKDGYCFKHHPEPNTIIRNRIKRIKVKNLTDNELDFLSKIIKEENVKRFRDNMKTPIN